VFFDIESIGWGYSDEATALDAAYLQGSRNLPPTEAAMAKVHDVGAIDC
jgi:hypothetical protein